uniref:Uncharacterized protein n=1 Tax=Meloidogyne hapla TaxID=6305 RepID=A0A1I8B3Y9_MELHA
MVANLILLILILINLNLQQIQIYGFEEDKTLLLTDRETTHHAIDYLILDQCMLRPEQLEHGSYALKFEREYPIMCNNGLLICYPSQLIGKNKRNGTIPSMPYRLSSFKQNEITKKCEIKRKEFCKGSEENIKCSKGAETRWHGILIQTEMNNKDHNINISISLSITNERFC